MRGKAWVPLPFFADSWITPAYAGKSGRGSTGGFLYRDHPRLCGEKHLPSIVNKVLKGSPPPMRGKGQMAVQVNRENRITPAYAGKSLHLRDSSREK